MSLKIDHITSAFAQLRISGLTVTPTPRSEFAALSRLEDMMAELEDNYGVCIGYNFEEQPDSNSHSGLKGSANQMVATNLGVRMIPDFNKTVPATLQAQANQSMTAIIGVVAKDKMRQVQASSRMPVGSGYRYRERYQRFNSPEALALNECATNKLQIGEINDYRESFLAYLSGEIISNYTIKTSVGLELLTSSISGTDIGFIDYRVQALKPQLSHQHVVITITTDTGRIEQRTVDFEVKYGDGTAAG